MAAKNPSNSSSNVAKDSQTSNTSAPPPATDSGWSSSTRTLVSVLLVGYLGLVILGPLSNPIASRHLTGPLAAVAAPMHQAMFLDHGYRFFAPNPGPSHLIFYSVTHNNGESTEGHFPDATKTSPRLLYHRWFMLSETIFEEHAMTPDRDSFESGQLEMAAAIDGLKKDGQFDLADQLRDERIRASKQYEVARERIDQLMQSLAVHLLEQHDGREIVISIRQRDIPQPIDVTTGKRLDDPVFLTEATPVAHFRRSSAGNLISIPLPVERDAIKQAPTEPIFGAPFESVPRGGQP